MTVVSGSSTALGRERSPTPSAATDGLAKLVAVPTAPAARATARRPSPAAHPIQGARRAMTAAPDRAGQRPRAIVIDPDPGSRRDRLDRELDVRVRVPPPSSSRQLARLLLEHRPRLLLFKHSLDDLPASFLAACSAYDVDVYMLADPVYGIFKPIRVWRFGGLPWLQIRRRNGRLGSERLKRLVDLALIMLSVPFWLPLVVLIALAVSANGSPLYFQDRIGAGGRSFRMVKFRSMRPDAEAETGPVLAGPEDQRITRVGALLRRLRFDELPQIWNVLCGHMSLVGPRPERPEFVAELRDLPDYDLRHLIRPGLTGIAQLTGGYAATAEEKLRCDLLYINGRTLRSDLMLLAMTALELFRGFPRG
jgi:lipopolysaccharide/colanic/teichoic acid biosynthesis glycosyltransferase